MSEPVRCTSCQRAYNAKFVKCPFCNAPNATASAVSTVPRAPAAVAPGLDFAAMAEQSIAAARPFLRLDFHPAAVVAIDAFFELNWGTQGEAPEVERWIIPQSKQNVIMQFGSIFGELMRREFGGHWQADADNPANPLNAGVVLGNGITAYPFAKVYRRMKNGVEDTLEPLYAHIRRASPAAAATDFEGWKRYARDFESLGRPDLALLFYDRALALGPIPVLRAAFQGMRDAAARAAAEQLAASAATELQRERERPVPVLAPAPVAATPKPLTASAQELAAARGELERLVAAGDHEKLLQAAEQLLALVPAEPGALIGKARALLHSGRAQQALDWLADFPSRNEVEPARTVLRAAAADQLGDVVQAEASYRSALASSRLSAEERRHCAARAEQLAGEPAVQSERINALPDMDDVLRAYAGLNASHPGYAEAWCERGVGLSMQGRNDEALACFDHAIAAEAGNPKAYDHKAVVLMRLKRFDEALHALDQGLRQCPRAGVLHTRRGICLTMADQAQAAIADLERSLAAEPDYIEAWAYKGDAESKCGRTAEAIVSVQRYLDLCGGHQGKLAMAARRQLFALRYPGRQRDPDRGQQLQEAAFHALQRGEQATALQYFDQAVEADPLAAELWLNRGACLRQLSRFEAALASYQQAEAIMGADDPIIEGQVACLLRLGRNEEALAGHDRALVRALHVSQRTLLAKAQTLRSLQRYADALPLYARLLRKFPDDRALQCERAEVLLAAGLLREARFACDALQEQAPEDARVQSLRARLATG